MNLDAILAALRTRTRPLGISTAAPFLRQFEHCLDGACPTTFFQGVSPRRWRQALKAAESQLVYDHGELAIDGEIIRRGRGDTGPSSADQGPKPSTLDLGPATLDPLPPHTLATFPAVITTTRQDRDGDVLETQGATLDPRAPLLWQHLPFEPIGRLLAPGQHTAAKLTARFSICDTPLGHDAALLAEHGALRVSHGFLPEEAEPLDPKEFAVAGFRVTKFDILEVSLVSVPSNPDAVITAFSRDKLAHPLVKLWAGSQFDSRPALAPVAIDLKRVAGGPATKSGRKFSATNTSKIKAARAMFASIAADDEADAEVALLAHKAADKLDDLFAGGGDDGSDYDADGQYDGTDLDAYTDDERASRAGRAVSTESAATIGEAIDHGRAIAAHERAAPGHKATAQAAVGKLRSVLAASDNDENAQDAGQDDDDGDLSYYGGNPTGTQPTGAPGAGPPAAGPQLSDAEAGKALAAEALTRLVSHHLRGGDLAPLAEVCRRFHEVATRLEQQRDADAEEPLLLAALAEG